MEANLLCEIHNSPIGGICGETACESQTQLLCIKCIVDAKSCIRTKSHKIISISEFFECAPNVEVFKLYNRIKNFNPNLSVEILKRINDIEKLNNENMRKLFENKFVVL